MYAAWYMWCSIFWHELYARKLPPSTMERLKGPQFWPELECCHWTQCLGTWLSADPVILFGKLAEESQSKISSLELKWGTNSEVTWVKHCRNCCCATSLPHLQFIPVHFMLDITHLDLHVVFPVFHTMHWLCDVSEWKADELPASFYRWPRPKKGKGFQLWTCYTVSYGHRAQLVGLFSGWFCPT